MLNCKTSPARWRDPDLVMRLDRLGAAHQSRLSFMRILLRRLKRENWTFDRPMFSFDAEGVGVGLYAAHGPKRSYSLICFGHKLKPEERSDRVIAHKWDSTFTLFDGVPSQADMTRLSRSIPKQEAGRVSRREISVSRANRSVRLFDHVLDSLASGVQPDRDACMAVGYLMRTTAVYGSGKFGAADREALADRGELALPFQAEMLSVYLTRAYTLDLVEEMARLRAPETAVPLEPDLRRCFGVGNSTGLGMAPFIVNHPLLVNSWVTAKEEALSRVCGQPDADAETKRVFKKWLIRAQQNAQSWRSGHPVQMGKRDALREDLRLLSRHVEDGALDGGHYPWRRLYDWASARLSLEGQEQLVSLMFEPYGDLVDPCENMLAAEEQKVFTIDGTMKIAEVKHILETAYRWALRIDWRIPANRARVWYVSAEKLEPRLGERFEEPVEPYEQPLAPGRDAWEMYRDLADWEEGEKLAAFLLKHPEHRYIARRLQITARYPYAEIRDNTISADLLPIDMLRFKLAFFGATHFDPRSDRWVRINMFKNAPFPDDLAAHDADEWCYPAAQGAVR